MVTLTIDGYQVSVPAGTTILEAARQANIKIPTLCYLKEINEIAACRICVVEVEGQDRLVPACATQVREGMVVNTYNDRVKRTRRINLRLILSQHNGDCTLCIRNGNCSLQELLRDNNLVYNNYPKDFTDKPWPGDEYLIRDETKCIKCMRCIQVCDKIQGMHIWDVVGTGSRTTVGVSLNRTLATSDCALCGQCVTHCPVGALYARDDIRKVYAALNDPEITTIVQVAPAVRAAWAENLGLSKEVATTGRMV